MEEEETETGAKKEKRYIAIFAATLGIMLVYLSLINLTSLREISPQEDLITSTTIALLTTTLYYLYEVNT